MFYSIREYQSKEQVTFTSDCIYRVSIYIFKEFCSMTWNVYLMCIMYTILLFIMPAYLMQAYSCYDRQEGI